MELRRSTPLAGRFCSCHEQLSQRAAVIVKGQKAAFLANEPRGEKQNSSLGICTVNALHPLANVAHGQGAVDASQIAFLALGPSDYASLPRQQLVQLDCWSLL